MAQCKKMLESSERCSNNAVPGAEYCAQHRPIKFNPVPKPSVPPPEKSPEIPRQQTPPPVRPPQWVARPSAAGERPHFPGLRSDARNILIAPQGLIWLSEQGAEGQRASFADRLGRLLAGLSQEMPLPGQVTVRMLPQGVGALISLIPPQPDRADLSRLYDSAAAAAAFSGGSLYVGQDRTFIQYRDGSVPRGYDATDVQTHSDEELYLVDSGGTHPISSTALAEAPLPELLLRIAPIPISGAEAPGQVFALAAEALYRMLSRYFRDHYMRYRVARVLAVTGEQLVLFEIAPRQDAPTGALVPAFVLTYLQSLPRCIVLTETWAEAGRRVLVEWRHRHPCAPRNIVEAFSPESLLLFTAGSDFSSHCVSPAPTFFEGDDLTEVKMAPARQIELKSALGQERLSLTLPVRLTQSTGPLPETAAIVLDADELGWLRRLLYRLPGEAFSAYRLCLGQEHSVLLSENSPIEAVPFGLPLRIVKGAQLFIPLRSRFVPDLPLALLAKSLELKEGIYAFLTPDFRLDVPRAAFAPLSHALVAETRRPSANFQIQPVAGLPKLAWTPPAQLEPVKTEPVKLIPHPTPDQPSQSTTAPESQERWLQQLLKKFSQSFHKSAPRPLGPSPKVMPLDASPAEPPAVEQFIEQRAEAYQNAGDHLSAAICFAMVGDNVNAARCYQVAARQLRNKDQERNPPALL